MPHCLPIGISSRLAVLRSPEACSHCRSIRLAFSPLRHAVRPVCLTQESQRHACLVTPPRRTIVPTNVPTNVPESAPKPSLYHAKAPFLCLWLCPTPEFCRAFLLSAPRVTSLHSTRCVVPPRVRLCASGATAHGVRPRHEAQEQRAHDGTSLTLGRSSRLVRGAHSSSSWRQVATRSRTRSARTQFLRRTVDAKP